MTAPDFHIPTGEDIIKKNEGVYKKVVRKGYDKEFVEPGCTVVCHVTGFLPDEEDKVFWSTKGGNPFSYKAGIGKSSGAPKEETLSLIKQEQVSPLEHQKRKPFLL